MKFIIFILLFSTSLVWANESMNEFVRRNNIKLIPENMHPELVWQFKQHYDQFPASLKREMLAKGAKITLIEGQGVTADPSFRHGTTFDGRSWDSVPGAGGNPSRRQPTRIVVNRLDYNGSANLFLHEHAHALNSLYKTQGLTKSRAWQEIKAANPGAMELLLHRCGNYCLANDDEFFAELFAIYHSGGQRMMEREAPGMARFFRNLNSVKDFTRTETTQFCLPFIGC